MANKGWSYTYECEFEQPAETLYAIMSDVSAYENWNPFLIKAAGDVCIEGVVKGRSKLGNTVTPFRHRVYQLTPNKSICWRDFGFMALFVCGFRERHLETKDGKTHYRCVVGMTGPFASITAKVFGPGLTSGVEAEARALEQQASLHSK